MASYSVTPVVLESTEAKASRSSSSSSSSSSSRPSRIISSASSSPSPLVETHQSVKIHQEELTKLISRLLISHEEKVAVYRELQGRMSEVINAVTTTNPAQPAVAQQTLILLRHLTANSDAIAADLWATLGDAGHAAVVAAATNPEQPALAEDALNLLVNLAFNSADRATQLWAILGADRRAAVVTAAITQSQPAMVKKALRLWTHLAANSYPTKAELWATLGAPGRAAVVAAATNPVQSTLAVHALILLGNLTANSDARKAELWLTLENTGRPALITAATNPGQPAVARLALRLLTQLTANSNVREAELWASLGNAGRTALITAATSPVQPVVASRALALLTNIAFGNGVRSAELWATFVAQRRSAVLTSTTPSAQPGVAEFALHLLTELTHFPYHGSDRICAALGVAGREGLIIAATTPGEPEVAWMAIDLIRNLQKNWHIDTPIWPLLQPRLALLWAVNQRQAVGHGATDFLYEQIQGNAHRTSQALNALSEVNPTTSMRRTIDALGQWGKRSSQYWAGTERLALYTGIVQANTTPQKIAVYMAAVMSGMNLWRYSREWREELRDQVLAIPVAAGVDPTQHRQHMRIGLDTACGNTAAVIESQVLSVPEKLQLLEILYSSREFLSAQTTQDELSRVQLTPHLSRNLKLQAIELILTHGQANRFQFKTILTWLKGEFKRDPQTGELTNRSTVFSNPSTLGDIDDEEIFALTTQRQQYLALYQNFRPHMTHDFIQEEIEHIERRVSGKEMPQDFGAILIHQLRQFQSTARTDSALEDERQYDRKIESK
ncbi:hypothetical protein [Polaromonas vacuolata]|uniref:hypothetical protein n=1 Tax=Polaromonas vacuolata TaxID=37448 RepID=UPI0014569792|nr:hypothetical protein [Polaromonas vacuolata]